MHPGENILYTANEWQVRIHYKSLVPIYVFPEMKLLLPKHNYNVPSPSSYTHVSVRYLYISRIGLHILLPRICDFVSYLSDDMFERRNCN